MRGMISCICCVFSLGKQASHITFWCTLWAMSVIPLIPFEDKFTSDRAVLFGLLSFWMQRCTSSAAHRRTSILIPWCTFELGGIQNGWLACWAPLLARPCLYILSHDVCRMRLWPLRQTMEVTSVTCMYMYLCIYIYIHVYTIHISYIHIFTYVPKCKAWSHGLVRRLVFEGQPSKQHYDALCELCQLSLWYSLRKSSHLTVLFCLACFLSGCSAATPLQLTVERAPWFHGVHSSSVAS